MIETMIALVVFAIVMGAVGATVLTGGGAFNQNLVSSSAEIRAQRMVDRIVSEISNAGSGTLSGPGADLFVPTGSSAGEQAWIDFQQNEGYAGGVTWGTNSRIALIYDEANDGVDNNSNGLIDECRVVLIRDQGGPSEQTVRWGGYVREYLQGETPDLADENGNGMVDERGLSFELDPITNTLTIRLTIELIDIKLQRPMTRTVETAVQLRN
ncbi:MAG: hypothetical protein ACI8X5_003040 [Planctomycetota bacterium]|jgi:hypothetical protein